MNSKVCVGDQFEISGMRMTVKSEQENVWILLNETTQDDVSIDKAFFDRMLKLGKAVVLDQ